ncbi:hypothetical protein BaRGS_00029451 [Batillaria attramentaria]|uniref:Uncharacterized protein n=1 Tax=Batillaria attramentaria TaxID=370345 RepID=A0ABD0JX45_9CAEN
MRVRCAGFPAWARDNWLCGDHHIAAARTFIKPRLCRKQKGQRGKLTNSAAGPLWHSPPAETKRRTRLDTPQDIVDSILRRTRHDSIRRRARLDTQKDTTRYSSGHDSILRRTRHDSILRRTRPDTQEHTSISGS